MFKPVPNLPFTGISELPYYVFVSFMVCLLLLFYFFISLTCSRPAVILLYYDILLLTLNQTFTYPAVFLRCHAVLRGDIPLGVPSGGRASTFAPALINNFELAPLSFRFNQGIKKKVCAS